MDFSEICGFPVKHRCLPLGFSLRSGSFVCFSVFHVDSVDSGMEIYRFPVNFIEICGFPVVFINQKYMRSRHVIKYGVSNEKPKNGIIREPVSKLISRPNI